MASTTLDEMLDTWNALTGTIRALESDTRHTIPSDGSYQELFTGFMKKHGIDTGAIAYRNTSTLTHEQIHFVYKFAGIGAKIPTNYSDVIGAMDHLENQGESLLYRMASNFIEALDGFSMKEALAYRDRLSRIIENDKSTGIFSVVPPLLAVEFAKIIEAGQSANANGNELQRRKATLDAVFNYLESNSSFGQLNLIFYTDSHWEISDRVDKIIEDKYGLKELNPTYIGHSLKCE